jgi:hypothetical protein
MNATVTTVLSLVPAILRSLASVPASSSFLTPAIDSILNAIATFVEAGDAGAAGLQALTQQIQAMVAAGRDPTPDEWAALIARSDAAHALIQGTTPPPTGT